MTPDIFHAIEHASIIAASAFVSGIWQGIVLAVAVWLCLRLIPKTTAATRFLIWSAVFLALALLPFLHILAPEAQQTVKQTALVHAVQVDICWGFAIAALWLVISIIRAAKLTASALQLRKIWNEALPVPADVVSASMLSDIDLRGAQLCTSRDVSSPSVIGFFSPKILIPEDLFEQLTAEELKQIVLHEIGHLRRADDWINLLQKIGLVIFPLNPALIWIEKRLCLERELACDDDVLRLTKAPKAYATCLTTLAERRLDQRAVTLSLGAWERRSELSQRVYSILRRADNLSSTQARLVMGVILAALIGGSVQLSRSPQFVSFSQPRTSTSPQIAALPTAGLQPTSFHPSMAHETLLKASMPTTPIATKPHQKNHLRQVKQNRRLTRQWVVLTSWSATRMVMTAPQPQILTTSWAAVPTAGGWLVFQL